MKKGEIWTRLKQLHGAYYFLSEQERILVGIGDDYVQVENKVFATLAKDIPVEVKWNGNYLHLGAIVEGLHFITLLSPLDSSTQKNRGK